jgi:hypothetical protein
MRILVLNATLWARRGAGERDRPGAAGFGRVPAFCQRFPNVFRRIAVWNMIQQHRGCCLGEYGLRSRSR